MQGASMKATEASGIHPWIRRALLTLIGAAIAAFGALVLSAPTAGAAEGDTDSGGPLSAVVAPVGDLVGQVLGTVTGAPAAEPATPVAPAPAPVAQPVPAVPQPAPAAPQPAPVAPAPAAPVDATPAPAAAQDPPADPIVPAPVAAAVEAVVSPIADQVEPITTPVLTPVAEALAPVTEQLEPLTTSVLGPLAPVLRPVTAVLDPVLGPLAPVLGALDPVLGVLDPVLEPLTPVVEPIVVPLPTPVTPGRDGHGVQPIPDPDLAVPSSAAPARTPTVVAPTERRANARTTADRVPGTDPAAGAPVTPATDDLRPVAPAGTGLPGAPVPAPSAPGGTTTQRGTDVADLTGTVPAPTLLGSTQVGSTASIAATPFLDIPNSPA
jgi:hypothetical protein